MKKLSKKRIEYLIKDERKAAREYDSYGLHEIAEDERKHRAILERMLITAR